jgi:hypothetical protein
VTAPPVEQFLEAAIAEALGPDADDVLIKALQQRLYAISANSLDHLGGLLALDTVLGIDSALIVQFIDAHTPKLIHINLESRQAVKELVLKGVGEGKPFLQVANEIEPIVGLHPRYARAVDRFRQKLIDKGVVNYEERTRRYAQSLRRARARTIAQTETGIIWDRSAWLQMRDAGVKGRIWITSRDQDVRDSHVPMDGQCRGINEPFESGAGNHLMHPHDQAAPLKEIANCRCTTAPVPGGCGQKAFTGRTESQRLYYWRITQVQILRHERVMDGISRQR